MKVVILTQYFPPEMGAPQSRLWETAVGLKKRGWDIRVITAMPNYPTGQIQQAYQGKLFYKETIDGITIYRYWLYASNAKKAIPRIVNMLSFSFMALFAWLKLVSFKPQYLITESPPLTLGLSGLLLSKICGAKHILNVSDLWPLSAFELGAIKKGKLYSSLEWLEKFLYKTAWGCLGQSEEIVQALIQNGAKKAHLYRNGVDNSRFKPDTHVISKEKKIIYAGLLGVAQGILKLCQQINFKELGFEFHIYGDGAEKKELELYLLNHPDRGIYFHGNAPRNEIPAILSKHDLTIIPLIKPIFGAIPSKIYEAMAAGLPIIFAGGGEGSLLINRHKTGWICTPSDFNAIKECLVSINSYSNQEWIELKKNCTVAAQQSFDREIQIDNLHKFLSNT